MRALGAYSLAILGAIAVFAVHVSGQATAGNVPNPTTTAFECTKRIDANDLKLLLDDVKAANPEALKHLMADPELRKIQVENLRELLAFACQAVKDGALDDPVHTTELENIRNETVAVEYDKISNKRTDLPPLASITDSRVEAFYKVPQNQAKFDEFLKAKIELLRRNDTFTENKEITKEEKEQAKEFFAKVCISEADSKLKARAIEPNFWSRVGPKVKLQQAQFLARIFSDVLTEKTAVSDLEIEKYIEGHPEFRLAEKRSKAETILAKAKAGEDFAALANEFSDDPGNLDAGGERWGGLYADVPKGRMVTAFEQAALSLNPGEISPGLVETEFGYHIIKLERKSETKQPDGAVGLLYDVRHILIATTYKDPENPAAREIPVNEFVRTKLENQKERELIAKVVAANPIEIADIPIAEPAAKKRRVRHRRLKRSK